MIRSDEEFGEEILETDMAKFMGRVDNALTTMKSDIKEIKEEQRRQSKQLDTKLENQNEEVRKYKEDLFESLDSCRDRHDNRLSDIRAGISDLDRAKNVAVGALTVIGSLTTLLFGLIAAAWAKLLGWI